MNSIQNAPLTSMYRIFIEPQVSYQARKKKMKESTGGMINVSIAAENVSGQGGNFRGMYNIFLFSFFFLSGQRIKFKIGWVSPFKFNHRKSENWAAEYAKHFSYFPFVRSSSGTSQLGEGCYMLMCEMVFIHISAWINIRKPQ